MNDVLILFVSSKYHMFESISCLFKCSCKAHCVPFIVP